MKNSLKIVRTGTMPVTLRKQRGLLRSWLIYDFRPGRFRKLIRFYRFFIKKGDTCFDLGAHTGNHTTAWLHMGAKVIALEPQPRFAELLRKKYVANNKVLVLQMAVAETIGTMSLMINNANPTISTLSDSWKATMREFDPGMVWDEEIKVRTTTLDRLIQVYGIPSFCKIDVEGFEEKALNGLNYVIPALSFEFFPTTPDRTFQCIDRLEKLGKYRYNYSFTERYRLNSDNWLDGNDLKEKIGNYRGRRSGDIYARIDTSDL